MASVVFGDDEVIRRVLSESRTWAVVGCSSRPGRDSGRIAARLQREGYRVVPINPNAAPEMLGQQVWPSLADVPQDIEVDVVDLFRRSSVVGRHVDEAIERGARAVWMQLGVIDPAAAQRAADAGLDVVMDRCPAIELPRMGRHDQGSDT